MPSSKYISVMTPFPFLFLPLNFKIESQFQLILELEFKIVTRQLMYVLSTSSFTCYTSTTATQ